MFLIHFRLFLSHIAAAVLTLPTLAVLTTHQTTRKTLAVPFLTITFATPATFILKLLHECNWLFFLDFLSGFFPTLSSLI